MDEEGGIKRESVGEMRKRILGGMIGSWERRKNGLFWGIYALFR